MRKISPASKYSQASDHWLNRNVWQQIQDVKSGFQKKNKASEVDVLSALKSSICLL